MTYCIFVNLVSREYNFEQGEAVHFSNGSDSNDIFLIYCICVFFTCWFLFRIVGPSACLQQLSDEVHPQQVSSPLQSHVARQTTILTPNHHFS